MNSPQTETHEPKGGWTPDVPLRVPPVLEWPPRPLAIVRYLFGFPSVYLPWTALYAVLAFGIWYLLSSVSRVFGEFSIAWFATLLVVNLTMAATFYGAWHSRLYGRRAQGVEFKYNPQWPSERGKQFLFGRQLLSNMIWSLGSGVPVCTAYLGLTLWAQASGIAPTASWSESPLYCALLMLALPFFHAVHFYFGHRLLHWQPLYDSVHYLHHANTNPGPWAGLAMHPLEHLVYFSGALLLWIVPATPFHAIFFITLVALAPVEGHCGFGKVRFGHACLITDGFYHYLHHKHFRVNFGDSLLIPLDRLFGTFHDGTRRVPRRRADE
jgi:sterol desaturase/sphingolipid hydroxylase (fatty acid hydroxylase superfamily)